MVSLANKVVLVISPKKTLKHLLQILQLFWLFCFFCVALFRRYCKRFLCIFIKNWRIFTIPFKKYITAITCQCPDYYGNYVAKLSLLSDANQDLLLYQLHPHQTVSLDGCNKYWLIWPEHCLLFQRPEHKHLCHISWTKRVLLACFICSDKF